MDSRMYQDIFATEFVDMFPRTNGDMLVHTILVGTGSRLPTSIRTYRAIWRRSAFCRKKPNKSKVSAISAEKWMCVFVSTEWV